MGASNASVAEAAAQTRALRGDGLTVMFLAVDSQLAGIIAVGDALKETTRGALRLQRAGDPPGRGSVVSLDRIAPEPAHCGTRHELLVGLGNYEYFAAEKCFNIHSIRRGSQQSELSLSFGLSVTTMFHMRSPRFLVLWAVLLTLPVYGLAAVAQRTCQEQMTHTGHVAQAGDCCPGQTDHGDGCKRLGDGPLGKGGSCSACKAGFSCKSPQSFEPTAGLVLYSQSFRSIAFADLPSVLTSHSPDGLWRPPTLT